MGDGVTFYSKPGETQLDDLDGLKLKIPGITRSQLDEAEAENIQKAVVKYWNAKKIKAFDLPFLKKLHRDMFSSVWRWAGSFRTLQTNIGSPPARIQSDLAILIEDLKAWPGNVESCARLHHRAVQTHPFRNGNGRWARLLSDLWMKKYLGNHVAWPIGLGQESPVRREYLTALKAADELDYMPLVKLYERLLYTV